MGQLKTKTSISPRQLWARRRNHEKRQMAWIWRELNFRKYLKTCYKTGTRILVLEEKK